MLIFERFKPLPFEKEGLLPEIPFEPRWNKVQLVPPKKLVTVPNSVTMNHNYQHDLESIWWILLWIVTSRIGHPDSDNMVAKYLNHDVRDFANRILLFSFGLTTIADSLHKDIANAFLPWGLETLRDSLYRAYLMRTVLGRLEVPESYSAIQVRFSQVLRAIRDAPGPWRGIPLRKDYTAMNERLVTLQDQIPGKRDCDATDTLEQRAAKRSRADE